MSASDIVQAAGWLARSSSTLVLTGAGMSTESGVPDFRSKDGYWRQMDPRTLATVEAMERNYPLFHEFYSMRLQHLAKCKPHQGHMLLADWEKRGLVRAVATQNVDGFHGQAGSRNVHELHGSIRDIRCMRCGAPAGVEPFLSAASCGSCGGKLRPGVVLFGEQLPQQAWDDSLAAIRSAEVVVVIGTSLQVYPVNQLPSMCGGLSVMINAEPTELDRKFDLVIHGMAGETLAALDRLLGTI